MPLGSIRILFRAPDTLALYGVPYRMRPGQAPGDLWRAKNTKGWLWLGSPGWWGRKSRKEQEKIKAFLAPMEAARLVPENPYEWTEIGQP